MMLTSLLQSMEQPRKIDLLLKIGRFTSPTLKKAVHLYFVDGYSQLIACLATDVKQQQLNKAIKRLNNINQIVCEINNL